MYCHMLCFIKILKPVVIIFHLFQYLAQHLHSRFEPSQATALKHLFSCHFLEGAFKTKYDSFHTYYVPKLFKHIRFSSSVAWEWSAICN